MRSFYYKQKGITIVEFTLVASTMLLIIFAILEVGIFTYNLQSLNDLTRRAARIATVCPAPTAARADAIMDIKTLAFSESEPSGLTSDKLSIEYLDGEGGVIDQPITIGDGGTHGDIKYVRAKIINFNYGFSGILNFLGNNGIVSMPSFETVLSAESLGVERPTSDGTEKYTICK